MYKKLLELLRNREWCEQRGGMKSWRNNNLTCNVGYNLPILSRVKTLKKSANMIKDKDQIYNECKKVFDFDFDSVQINKNFKCPPHKDAKNSDNSLTVSLGEFTGGLLNVEFEDEIRKIDTKEKPFIFDGAKYKHWVDDFEGERYSIVLFKFNIRCSHKVAVVWNDEAVNTVKALGITRGIKIFVFNEEQRKEARDKIPRLKIEIVKNETEMINSYKTKNDCVVVLKDKLKDEMNPEWFSNIFIETKNQLNNYWVVGNGNKNYGFIVEDEMEGHKVWDCVCETVPKTLVSSLTEKIQICIPTHNRPDILKQTTYKLLERDYKDFSSIHCFINDEKQKQQYIDAGINLNFIETKTKGIGACRTFIRNYFPTGTKIIMLDDDLMDIKQKGWVDTEQEQTKSMNLPVLFDYMFSIMKKEDVKFSGCNPCPNEYFMRKGYSQNLRYTGGHLIAEIIRDKNERINVEYNHFEDYVANIEYFIKDKKLIRFNDIYVKTKYFNPVGGIAETYGSLNNRKDITESVANEIIEKYGRKYGCVIFNKSAKCFNIKLNFRCKTV